MMGCFPASSPSKQFWGPFKRVMFFKVFRWNQKNISATGSKHVYCCGLMFYSLDRYFYNLPSGELTFCNGKSPFFMGKSTISMAMFNCYVSSPEGNNRGREIISKVLLDHSSTVLKAVSMVRRKRKVLGSMLCWFLSQSCRSRRITLENLLDQKLQDQ